MRHQKKKYNKLGRTRSHRKATLAALSNALIEHKRITTTLTKAKALRVFVEPLINRAKEDTMHNRRQVFRHLNDKYAVTELFGDIATRITERPGGYTRVIKLGQRAGDSAEMAVIELVDYNDIKPDGKGDTKKSRTRRGGRRRSSAEKPDEGDAVEAAAEEPTPEPEAEVAADEPAPEPEAEAAAEEPAPEPEAEVAAEEPAPEPEAEDAPESDASEEPAEDEKEK